MNTSFDNKANIKGLQQLFDSQKIDKKHAYENRFLNNEKLQTYDAIFENVQKQIDNLENNIINKANDSKENQLDLQQQYDQEESDLEQQQDQEESSEQEEQPDLEESIRETDSQFEQMQNDFIMKFKQEQTQQQQQRSQIQQNIGTLNKYNDISINTTALQDQNAMKSAVYNKNECGILYQYEKEELLEDIEELQESLLNEGVKQQEIPPFNRNMSMQQLKEVKSILIKKWKRRYSRSIVEDILLMAVKGIENVFDGSTTFLGFSPNLSGFGNSVILSAKQHRQEITKMVERNCERYGIGVRDKFIAKIVTSAIKRNMLNKAKNNTENHSEHMRNIHNLNKK